MKNIGIRFLGMSLLIMISGVFVLANPSVAAKEKISVEELLTKHKQSIGSPAALAAHKSMMAVGTSKALFKGRGTGQTTGIVVLASQGNQNMIGMKFNNTDYQFETMGFDGKNLTVGYAKAGTRSLLGSFIRVNEKTFKNGIMGGTLSTAWELLNYSKKRGKLKYSGEKKIDDVKLYKFSYNPKKGSDMDVAFFFDKTTFRHVRTEYKRVISASLGRATGNPSQGIATSRVDNSARQSETRYKMVEKFSEFKPEGGLTLPHTYKLYLEVLTGNGTTAYDWTMELQQFAFNQPYDVSQFRVGAISGR
ncbi:MAG: hypothetical protein HKN25_09315 [Pyrinomonadaceae bacterium]|nr:hypothetical protein [Pyrinomonadaceae bacterium]